MKTDKKQPSTGYALFALGGVLAIILGGNIFFDAPLHIMFFISWLFIIPVSMYLNYTYEEINNSMMDSIKGGMGPILLLMAVGAVIGSWIASGAVPGIIYYGLKMITPEYFLLTAYLLCVVVSVATGTSWATAGTAGIAMLAIGESLGVPTGMIVGAIISGSFFGDMISPMSDSTNVVAAAVKVDLFTHIKELSFIAIPSMIISGILYYFIGLTVSVDNFDPSYIEGLYQSIAVYFNVGIIAFIPVFVLLILLILKKPAVPSMLISSLIAVMVAIFYQDFPMGEAMASMWNGFTISTGEQFLDSLLNRGGVVSMLETTTLMTFAFGMIGAFNVTGILKASIEPVIKITNSIPKLTFASQAIALLGNVMGTNTFALLMTGSLMLPAYEEFGLHPTNLSKAINATSTVIAPLIPWNIAGIYIIGLFNVGVVEYLPYSFISYVTPIVAFVMVLLKFRIQPITIDMKEKTVENI